MINSANSLGKACRRKSLPEKLPLMFTASHSSERSSNCTDVNKTVTESPSSGMLGRSLTLPQLEMPPVVELGSQKLSSFREISEQAIQGALIPGHRRARLNGETEVGSKYNEEKIRTDSE